MSYAFIITHIYIVIFFSVDLIVHTKTNLISYLWNLQNVIKCSLPEFLFCGCQLAL
jgi:hypothetical protein